MVCRFKKGLYRKPIKRRGRENRGETMSTGWGYGYYGVTTERTVGNLSDINGTDRQLLYVLFIGALSVCYRGLLFVVCAAQSTVGPYRQHAVKYDR